MTNHWNDIDNASLVLVFGANPAENHPACFNHINMARFGNKDAKLVVVDPRQTRTARQCDPYRGEFYARIRPGTDIAFINGMLNWILTSASAYDGGTAFNNMLSWHNGTAGNSNSYGRTFVDDSGTTVTLSQTVLSGAAAYDGLPASGLYKGYPKYADTRFKVNAAGDDYARAVLTVSSGVGEGKGRFTDFPVILDSVADPDSVFSKLKAHVAPYTLATVASICGCTEQDIVNVAKVLLDNSRFKSGDFGASQATPTSANYKAGTILYAMGQTQHSYGSQNIKGLAQLQTLLGNMGRPGGGINALRGIHNVQGSTDMGLLFDAIPGYSGNPGVGETYAHYLDALFGNRVENHTASSGGKGITAPSAFGLQQRGFSNMTTEWFGNGTSVGTDIEKLYDLWPKGNGLQHITAFRRMISGEIKALVCWGQNPAVSEANQKKIRDALENLDLLVCVDMFENETAACKRKPGGVTYLIPAASHVEEAGSVTNSGRWLQWRERAVPPVGNSKSDVELLLRFAKALSEAGAFSHITSHWGTLGTPIAGNAFDVLYAKYGWDGVSDFESVSATSEVWGAHQTAPSSATVYGSEVVAEGLYKEICRPLNALNDGTGSTVTGGTMWIYSGSDATATSGVGGWNSGAAWNLNVMPVVTAASGAGTVAVPWQMKNRAKSRDKTSGAAVNNASNYPRWGWAWLLNRRVFYNNGEVSGDQSDTFVSPGVVSCLFTAHPDSTQLLADWSLVYRKYKVFNDKPSTVHAAHADYNTSSPHFLSPGYSLAGRFAAHTEPYESPRPELKTAYGNNTSKGSPLIPADTEVGSVSQYPLVLTTIRAVEHFQGGVLTRNNPWNAEAEPEPWIEINPVDARANGINNGDWVNIVTARSDSTGDQQGRTEYAAGFAKGFRARVDNGIAGYQRVGPGVVAIPWHWGDRGLVTGSRANDLCIDAYDANTMISEYKACLCRIEKA